MGLAQLRPRPLQRIDSRYKPVAIVDIGSNSVRLVIYEGPWRHASPLHNEKAICAIGRNMVPTGRARPGRHDFALETSRGFAPMRRHSVKDVGAVATSAARDASNGQRIRSPRGEVRLGSADTHSFRRGRGASIAAEGTLGGNPLAPMGWSPISAAAVSTW